MRDKWYSNNSDELMNLPSKLNTGLWYLDIYDLVCMRMYYANACWNAYEL